MSLKLITRVSDLEFQKDPLVKYVLFALCNFADSDDHAWPSYPTIAKFCSISERTAKRHIQTLEKTGYLIKTKRVHSNGRDTSNLYKINLNPSHLDEEKENLVIHKGVTVSPPRVSRCHPSKENLHLEHKEKYKKEKKEIQALDAKLDSQIEEVFEHWKKTFNQPESKLDTKRTKCIAKALQTFSVAQLKQAIKGCSLSQFHTQAGFFQISLITKDSEKVEYFIQIAKKPSLGRNLKASEAKYTPSADGYPFEEKKVGSKVPKVEKIDHDPEKIGKYISEMKMSANKGKEKMMC